MIFKNFFTLILLLGFSLSINATPIVGWIDDFEGEPADYSLMRGKQPLPIEFFTPLQNGDQIEARHSQHRMTLKLGDTQSIKISQKNSPYFVNSLGKVPTQFDNLLTWVGEWITIWFRAEKEVGWQVSSNVKSGASEVPYMKLLTVAKRPDLKMQITKGTKPLYLAWAGGTPPYHVEIKRGQKTLVSLKKLPIGRIHTLTCISLQDGDYHVIVSDAKQQLMKYTFMVVANKPVYPPELQKANLPTFTRMTLQAAWLAAQDGGIWAFEAYQSVAPIAQYYQPARILRDTLEKGKRVVEPK